MPTKQAPRKTTEAELRDLIEKRGMKMPEVAQHLGISLSMIRQACSVLGIRSRPKYEFHGSRVRAYFEDFRSGMTLEEIGVKHECTRQNVHMALKKAGLPASQRDLVLWLLKQQAPKLQPVTDGVDIDAVHRRAA